MRLLMIVQGDWGKRIADHIASEASSDWELARWQAPPVLPQVIDDPDEFLPTALEETDLLLVLTESPGLTDLAPDLAARCGAQAVIVPVDRRPWAPPGLIRQTQRRLEAQGLEHAFPRPFCSIHPTERQHPLINAFAERFGSPNVSCQIAASVITACEMTRGAPCGNTRHILENLPGVSVQDVEEQAGLLHHYYPCWGGMGSDPVHGEHTLLHIAAAMSQKAVAQAVKEAGTAPSADLETRIREVERQLADARARMPKHTPPVALFAQIDDLEIELERLRALRDSDQAE